VVPPRDRAALAGAIARLVADPALRLRLGDAGRERTLRDFSLERGIDRLVARFGGAAVAR
jgi:glycosyltransferase involved in cell wall biosynthesis